MHVMSVRKHILSSIQGALQKSGVSDPVPVLEHPSELSHGDYATSAALQYAKQLGKNPRALAEELVAAMGRVEDVEKIDIAGPGFINFHLSGNALASSIGDAVEVERWGANKTLEGKRVLVEYTQPNPFKEFHIGHLMSNAIGESIARLFEFSGAEVKRANYQGDVGPHVAKAIWGLLQISPAGIDSAAALGTAYATGAKAYESDENVKAAIDEINQKVYDKLDPKINEIYEEGRQVSLDHFEKLYAILGTKFDFYFFESVTAPKGLELVKAHIEIFEQSDGAVVYRGEQDGLHTRVFITSRGLPTYETKDLGLAVLKSETWSFDESYTVTASEQLEYFRVMLAVLAKILPDVAQKTRHITHGMMRLTTGKMSSRTGDVITGESLLNDLIGSAKERAKESRAEDHEKLAEQVAVAAIKYQILRQASGKDTVFEEDRALSLEGDSGPYLQYTYARAYAVVEKAASQNIYPRFDESVPISDVARIVHRFPEVVERAVGEREPHHIATYLLGLAAAFNSWYAQEQILDGSHTQAHKVSLASAVAHTIENGLTILGIPTPQKM